MTKKKITFYLLFFILLYIGLIAQSKIYYNSIDQKLDTFDINNDGVFSLEEQTPEQQKYSNIAIGTYRGMIPITGVFISFVVTLFVFVLAEIYRFILKRKNKRNVNKFKFTNNGNTNERCGK